MCLPRSTPSIRTCIRRIRPKTQAELEWRAHELSLHAAIEKAALAKNSRDKRYSQQRRLNRVALQQTLGVLSEQAGAIGKVRSSDDLFAVVYAAREPIT